MGKKSKRRGGTGGGRKGRHAGAGVGAGEVGVSSGSYLDQLIAATASRAATPTLTPAEAVALLETVPPPTSLKGIVSTNDDPGKCALCLSPSALVVPCGALGEAFSIVPQSCCGKRFRNACVGADNNRGTALDLVGELFSIVPQLCCGKRFCNACLGADDNCGTALDLLGERRCTFCNCTESDRAMKIFESREPWAHYSMGIVHCHSEDLWTNGAFDLMVQAASQGHPEAFLSLSELCRGEWGYPRDLMAAQAFAMKARSLHPDLALRSNEILVGVAEGYLEDGAVEEADAIFTDVAKEADSNALDVDLCDKLVVYLYPMEQYQLAGEMSAMSFCHGAIESALCASDCYALSEHYALSKLWLSVACKTKSGYDDAVEKWSERAQHKMVEDVHMCWSHAKQRRDEIRSELCWIRDSCGGCGAALEGDTRKYCRGCMAFCYCSRECQKLHWNRPDADGGHSTECKEAQDQARKILAAIQFGKVDLSSKKNE